MKSTLLAAMVLLVPALAASADEIKLDSRIDSVDLFKNGLAVVERSAQVNGPGVYRIEDVPSPVHGTFWITGDGPIQTQVTMREVDSPARSNATQDFQQELVGRQVTIHFHDGNTPAASGKIVQLAQPKGDDVWNRTYQQPQYYYGGYQNPPLGQGQFLVLENDQGRMYVDSTLIASMQIEGANSNVRRREPVLLLNVGDAAKAPQTIHINYLTKGISWAPSYRVSLDDDKSLTLEQQAVIKNELGDLTDTDVRLISGFPSIQFARVTSPLSLNQSWAQFFAQMNENPAEMNNAMANAAQQQAPAYNNDPGHVGIDLSALPSSEGVDLHYESIGKHTMAEGDSLALSVSKASASYERIVEWVIPDTRDPDGHSIDPRNREDADKFQDSAWDAIRFKNPLSFAMTTAPAMILDGGHFAGQRMSYWVNSGEQTTLQINKALSLRTRAVEEEDQQENRKEIYIGGRRFGKVGVKGQLTIGNHRDRDINLIIRRQFSGDLVNADENPKLVLREEGVYSVNRRNELTWTLSLKSGEEKTLNYSYTVLVEF